MHTFMILYDWPSCLTRFTADVLLSHNIMRETRNSDIFRYTNFSPHFLQERTHICILIQQFSNTKVIQHYIQQFFQHPYIQHHCRESSIICGKNSLPEVASYQLSEDRAAMALAWNAPPDAVGADTVTGRRNVST